MQRYSLFLTPSAADFAYTADLIRELSAGQGRRPFEPHVTVHSGDLGDLATLKRRVTAAASGILPFSLRIRGISCGESYFKSMFIEFEESTVLRSIHGRMWQGDEAASGYVLAPHLSLLYGDMPTHHRESLARGIRLDRSELLFDQLKIMTPRNREEGWRDTLRWQPLFRLMLGVSDGDA